MNDTLDLEADLLFCEREELSHIGYFLAQWDSLRDRGVIAEDVHAEITAEYAARCQSLRKDGLYRAALGRARRQGAGSPVEALAWAERAHQIDPDQPEAPALAVEILRLMGRDDDAIARCEAAAARFPSLRERLDSLRNEHANKAARDLLAQTRSALRAKRDAEAIVLCERALSLVPDDSQALVLLAFAHRRLGHLSEALALYERLHGHEPESPIWGRWVDELQRRRAEPSPAQEGLAGDENASLPAPSLFGQVAAPEPTLTWKNVTAEFLLDHWQKLILGLAVLLIVVSSNVGVYQLVGPRLWSPAGKCLLALSYTSLCAAFGVGLLRWGAERAGRMMLLTSLIVVPANFMLVGQIRLLLQPTAFGLAVALLDAAALFALMRVVTATLGLRRGGLFLTLALFALSAFNALTSRGTPFPWGFASLVVPAGLYLAAVVWLNTRYQAETAEEQRDFAHFALALLTFALLSGVVRTGVSVLRPVAPCLFAVPAMLLAIACVHTAHHLRRFEKDPRQALILRFGGVVLAALAFALALSRPPTPSPLLSGNTLATAVLGLLLFAAMLRAYRHPSYLYLAFAALFVGYFGGFYFLVDLLRAVEEAASSALGYRHKLPLAFKSLNGLVFNVVLASLSLVFAKRWDDTRLARHCHWLGLPLSVAACALACFEPKAAVLCLSGYALLFTCAVSMFREPRVLYLACASLMGALFFATQLASGATVTTHGGVAVAIGFCFLAIKVAQRLLGTDMAYRRPLWHAALVAAGLAMVCGLNGGPSSASALVLGFVAILGVLLYLDEPVVPVAYLTALNANIAYAFLVASGADPWGWVFQPGQHAVVILAAALGLAALATVVRHAGALMRPLWPIVLAEVGLGSLLCFVDAVVCALSPEPAAFATLSLALALGMVALVATSVWGLRSKAIVGLAIVLGSAAYVAGVLGAFGMLSVQQIGPWLAVAIGLLGLALYAVGRELRLRGASALFVDPLWCAAPVVVGVTWLFCAFSWNQYLPVALAMGLTGLTLTAMTCDEPSPVPAHLSLTALLAVWLCGFQILSGGNAAPLSAYGLCLVMLALGLLLAAEGVRQGVQGHVAADREFARRDTAAALVFSSALPAFALMMTVTGVVLAICDWIPGGTSAAVLGLAALTMFWQTRTYRDAAPVHAGIGLAVASALVFCSWTVGWADQGVGLGWLAFTAAFAGLLLWCAGMFVRGRAGMALFDGPCWMWASALTGATFALAVCGRAGSRAAFSIAAPALLLNTLACVLLAVVRRLPGWTFAAVGSLVTGVYVVLLSVGRPDPRLAYVLGLVAVVLAIVLWVVGWLCRHRLSPEWERVFALPLSVSSLALTVLAIPPAYHSPVSMVLVSVAFLLISKSFPRAEWLYPTLAALGCAVYFAWLDGVSRSHLVMAVTGAAYVVWGLGVLLRRYRRHVLTVLGLSAISCEFPCFNTSILLGAIAAWLKIDGVAEQGMAWSAQPGLAFALALLCLLMLTAYPWRLWAHACAVLSTLGLAMLAAPRVLEPAQWILATLLVANGMFLVYRAVKRSEEGLLARFQVAGEGYADVLANWSFAYWAIAVALAGALVVSTTVAAVSDLFPALAMSGATWWSVLLALTLAVLYLAVVRPRSATDEALICVWLVATLCLWWLGAPASPLVTRLGMSAVVYLPIATAAMTLAALRSALAEVSERRLTLYLEFLGVGLGGSAVALTTGEIRAATVCTLAMVAVAFGILALGRGRVAPAYAAAALTATTCGCAALVVCRWLGIGTISSQTTAVALGGLAAVYWLSAVAAGIRRSEPWIALALEQSALAGAFLTVLSVIAARVCGDVCRDQDALLGVGVLLALALYATVQAARWRAEWLVYAAQTLLIGAYYAYRSAFALNLATDAAVLTLFGYLDLAVAEVMQRQRLELYARPTLYFSLAMPLIPLGTAVAYGQLDDLNLLFIFTVATFYGVACYKMQWKTLGYAAAVLYNVFLWIFWARAGYRLADHSQFFLIPVGFSAILFAEVNRGELGRAYVNTIRGLGLVIIYSSLAVPIWQFESFGAWLALLLLSLLGIFVGIGLRVQSFLWLGLVCFVLDVIYQLGRLGLEHALAKWAIMLVLGILLVLFVALNEKKRIVLTMREFYAQVRQWD